MVQRARVAIVTGASSGIGKATVALLRQRGIRAIAVARRLRDGEQTRRCDVGNERQVAAVFGRIRREHGRLDLVVNCAGLVAKAGPLALRQSDWDAMLRVNLVGTYFCCKHALPAMRAQRYGRIVNVSSIAGRRYSRTASAAYTCSKYGVIGLTRQLAVQFAGEGITINCVCPSETDTEMLRGVATAARRRQIAAAHPMGRLARPAEIAEAIAFLGSSEASYINGAVLDVNGGVL